MSDPFSAYARIASGGDLAPPPAPPVNTKPNILKIDGIAVTSDRLIALDQIARRSAAVRAGHADALAEMRARREDLRQRAGLLRSRIGLDRRSQSAETNLAELDCEIAVTTSRMSETEAELGEAAAAAAVARSNLKTALSFANEHGLPVPAGIEGVR